MVRGIRFLPLLFAAATTLVAQNPAGIDRRLRFAVRLADQPDSALSLVDRMREYHIPGLSFAVIDNYRVVFAKGYGVAEFGGTKPVDTTTLFLAGSISKPVFASGLLRIIEERRLSLDADVNEYLKSWKLPESRFTEREKVTLRRLLSHSAGLTVWGFPGYATTASIPTVPQVLDGAAPANTAAVRNDTTPGARWLYSGGGITIAQLLVTDVAGEPFPALMRRLVLQPASMSRSTYENPLPAARHSEAASGHERLDTPVPGRFHVYPEMAAAGLWTTASDLARWAIALSRSYRGEPGGVLSTTMAKQMVSKQIQQKPPYGNGYWGLGVSVAGDGDSISFSHGGRDEGFVATMVMWPNRGRGFVILMNGVQGGLMAEIQRAFAEEYGFGAPARPTKNLVKLPSATLAGFGGRYSTVVNRDTVRIDISVSRDEKMLIARDLVSGRTQPLAPVGGDAFVNLENATELTFERSGGAGSPVRAMATGPAQNRRVFTKQ